MIPFASRKNELLRAALVKTGSAWITCAGGSMEPTIPRGARVMVVPCQTPRPGEVVLFETQKGPMAHRVLLRIPQALVPWRGGGLIVHAGDAGRLWGLGLGMGAGLADERSVLGKIVGVAPVVARTRRVLGTLNAFARALAGRLRPRERPRML